MKERISKLLTIKSIVTLLMTVVFCVLALRGVLSGQEFLTVFTTVIAFYFGTQAMRGAAADSSGANGKTDTEAVGTVPAAEVTGKQEAVEVGMYKQVHPSGDGTEQDILVTGFAG